MITGIIQRQQSAHYRRYSVFLLHSIYKIMCGQCLTYVIYLNKDNPTMSKGKHNFHLKGKREFYFL